MSASVSATWLLGGVICYGAIIRPGDAAPLIVLWMAEEAT